MSFKMAEEERNPNLNDNGHTIYPKYVYPKGVKAGGFIVNNKKEENEVMGNLKSEDTGSKKDDGKKKAAGWDE